MSIVPRLKHNVEKHIETGPAASPEHCRAAGVVAPVFDSPSNKSASCLILEHSIISTSFTSVDMICELYGYIYIRIYIYSYAMLYSHTPCTCILVAVLRCFKKHPDNSWLSPISVLFLEICSGERLLSRKWRGVATWAERPQKLRVCKTHQNTSKHRCFDLVGQPFSQVRFRGF